MPKVRTRIRRPAPVSEALQQIGERIRQARTEVGLSQAQLGAPHFTRAYVSAIELGKVRPAMKSLEFMAERLGKPTSYFLEDPQADRRRLEREFEIRSAEALLSRQTAAQAIQRATPLLEVASSGAERCRIHLILGTANDPLGYAYRALGDLDAATGYIQRALATNEALQDLTATAMFHNTLAVIAAERGHFQAAAQHVERAIRIARASGPAFNLPHFICTKAEAEIKEGKLDEAHADAEEALATANTVGNKRAAAAAK